MRRWIPLVVMMLQTGMSSPALAGPSESDPPAAVVQKAEQMFREAREAMRRQDYRKALKLLTTSHAVVPGVGKLANIAICEEALGMVASALEHFRAVAEQLPKDDPRRSTVDGFLAALPARLPHVRIELAAGAPEGTSVQLDEVTVPADKLGQDVPIDPGKHEIVVSAPGRPDRRYEVISEEGKRAACTVEPGDAPAAPSVPAAMTVPKALAAVTTPIAAPPPPVPLGDSGRRLAPTVLFGVVSAAGIGVGATFVALREDKRAAAVLLGQDVDFSGASCVIFAENYEPGICTALRDATSTGDMYGSLAWVGFVTGGLAAAGAVTYLLLSRPKKAAAPAVALSVVPALGPSEQGISIVGAF